MLIIRGPTKPYIFWIKIILAIFLAKTRQDHLLRPDQRDHLFWLIKRIIKKINAESAVFTLSCFHKPLVCEGLWKLIFFHGFVFFCLGVPWKFLSLAFSPKVFSWLPICKATPKKYLGQKPNSKLFKVAPHMEVTWILILKSPWDSVTQPVWVYPESFNIDFLPQNVFLTSPHL